MDLQSRLNALVQDLKSRMRRDPIPNLRIPFRSGVAALMRSNPALYNTNNLTPDQYSEYIDSVEKYGMPVDPDVEQAAADLLGDRLVRSQHQINLANIHMINLANIHMYPG